MKKHLFVIGMAVVLCVFVTACSAQGQEQGNTNTRTIQKEFPQKVQVKEASKLDQMEEPEKGETTAIMHVKDYGEIKIKFFPQDSPLAVENFLTLAKNGYYDGLTFHRVLDDFMIQGGDPDGNGMGGSSIWGEVFENEASDSLLPLRGALCMANAGANTNGSQFFIVQLKNPTESSFTSANITQEQKELFLQYGGTPWLSGGYTVLGQVYEGLDIVDQIAGVKTDGSDKPLEDVIVESIEVAEY